MKIILLTLSPNLQYDRNDFESAHLSGWAKNFARGLLSNTKNYEVECWSLYDTKVFGKRGVSVLEGGDSKWYCKGLLFKFFPSVNFLNEPISFELINNIKKEINSGNEVIFHSQSIHKFMHMIASILCRNVPFVASQRGPGGPPILMFKHSRAKLSYIIKHFFEYFSNKYLDFLFCGSRGEYKFSKSQIGNDKVMLERGGGIDFSQINKKSKKEIRKELNLPIESKIIIHVGRFNHYNGLDIILDIYKNLKQRSKIIFLIIGGKKDQALYSKLKKSDAKVMEYIPHSQVLKYIKASDLSINLVGYRHHLLFGGMGTFVVESLSLATPTISSTLIHFQGHKNEINELGYLPKYPFENKEIEHKILEILNNETSFPNITEVSRKYFSWDKVIENHKRVYDRLVNLYYN